MRNPFKNSYEKLATSREYKSVDGRLKWISRAIAVISGLSTAWANGYSHAAVIGRVWAVVLGLLTLAIVEGSLFTLDAGLRSTFKGGTQRTLAWIGKWAIKGTMCANAAYLCCVIAAIPPPPDLLWWNRWSFAIHFGVGLILIPMIRDADPVIANRMLELRSETAQQDQIISRLSTAIGSPFALLGARIRGVLDALALGLGLLRNREGFNQERYLSNLNSTARRNFNYVEGGRQIGPASPPWGGDDDQDSPPPKVRDIGDRSGN